MCEDLNYEGVRSEQIDGGGEEVLHPSTEVVSGQLVFEMHVEDFLMNVMSQKDPRGLLNLIQVSAWNFLAELCNCFTAS